jgi:hypothetical protein
MVVGLVLFVSGCTEAFASLGDDLAHFQLRAHHGVLILGLFNMLSSLPDLIEGIERILDAREARREWQARNRK